MSQHDQTYIEKFQSEDTSDNGWKNHATWNVALWISNDEGLYNFVKDFSDYATFRDTMRQMGNLETPDRVAYNDESLDVERLDELIAEIV